MAAKYYSAESGEKFSVINGSGISAYEGGKTTLHDMGSTAYWRDLDSVAKALFKKQRPSISPANDDIFTVKQFAPSDPFYYYMNYDKSPVYAANSITDRLFAKGGIANQPSIFGEAGAEAAVPLPDGRSIPVTLKREAANDSNRETAEEIKQLRAELKAALAELNRHAQNSNNIKQAGFKQIIEENKKQSESLETINSNTRLQRRASA